MSMEWDPSRQRELIREKRAALERDRARSGQAAPTGLRPRISRIELSKVLDRSPWVSGKNGLLPKLSEQSPDPLNDLELAEVLRVAPERWRPVLALMAASGLRWGEIRALTWKDVRELPYPHLVVSKSHESATKSRKVREVPLVFEAAEVLRGLSRPADRASALFSWLPETASWIRRYVIRS